MSRRVKGARRPSKRRESPAVQTLEISGELDRLEAETVKIQLQLMAQRHGVTLSEFTIRRRGQGGLSA